MKNQGERIRFARENMGYSQTDFASMCGISKQTLYKYENDIITNIPLDVVQKMSDALGVPFSWIINMGNQLTDEESKIIQRYRKNKNFKTIIDILMEGKQ